MNSLRHIIGFVFAIFLIAGCDGNTSYEEALSENKDRFESKQLEDAKFVMDARSRNMLTIKACELAADTAYSALIVDFAKTNLEEHRRLDEQLVDLADEKDIALPDELSSEHNELLKQLRSADRSEFDELFTRIVRRVIGENSSAFTTKATQASDDDVRAFAAKNLDLLQSHSQSLSSVEQGLLDTSDE